MASPRRESRSLPLDTRLPFTEDERSQRAAIEQSLDELRSKKPTLDPQEHERQLEPLMLRLARLYQAAEKRLEEEKSSSE